MGGDATRTHAGFADVRRLDYRGAIPAMGQEHEINTARHQGLGLAMRRQAACDIHHRITYQSADLRAESMSTLNGHDCQIIVDRYNQETARAYMKKGTIYIAGPMSGIEECNFPLFDMAAADLKAKGWNVINPAQMDRDIGFDPVVDIADADFLQAAMARDCEAIIHSADAIAMLPGWERSKGARGEMGLAIWKHIPAYQWPDMTEIKHANHLVEWEKQPIISPKNESDSVNCNQVTQSRVTANTENGCETQPIAPRLPVDAAERKRTPIASGVLDYFPDALAEVARCSYVGNEQHNPGQPLHWDRSKSTDESDCLIRHFIERGTNDTDGLRHSGKLAWRALAYLQKEIENQRTA